MPSLERAHATRPYRDNRSAFFSCLPWHAKSATVEILVSDQCDCCPPLLVGGRFDSRIRSDAKSRKVANVRSHTRACFFMAKYNEIQADLLGADRKNERRNRGLVAAATTVTFTPPLSG